METCDGAAATAFRLLLRSFSGVTAAVQSLPDALKTGVSATPDLALLHGNLTTAAQLHAFLQLQAALPHTGLVMVSNEQDEELCLRALEAGADDSITEEGLTERYLRKAVAKSRQRRRAEKERSQSRGQLLACLQNTPNVAVQWYNGRGEAVFWNKASEHLFGWAEEEALGKTVDVLITVPEHRDYWLQRMAQLKQRPSEVLTAEWIFTRPDGDRRYCLSTLFAVSSAESEPLYVCMDVDITERYVMEEALRQSEENYFTLFNRASDAIFINDLEGRFFDVNEKACALTGYSKEQLMQRKVHDLYPPGELQQRPIRWPQILHGERTCFERSLLLSNGETIPVEVTAQLIGAGRVMAIMRDVSERRRAEKALRQSEEKYRSLIEEQADAIAIFNKDGSIVDVNGSATALIGYSKEELVQMKWNSVLLKEELITDPVDFTQLQTGASAIRQRKMQRKDGSVVETEVHIKHLSDGLFLASVRDLAERIDVQRRLQKEFELSESIINSLPGLFYLFTREGWYLRWNRRQEIITEYSAAEIVRMNPLDFITGADKEAVQKAMNETFETGQSAVEAGLLTKRGRIIPYYFTGIRAQYAGTECLLGTGIDLSALKNLERQLSQQKIAGQKKVMQAMIDAEEKERHKLGLELHDNVNQILSVVRMYLSVLNAGEKMEEITLPKAMDLLNNAMTEIRHLSHSLAVSYKFETGLTGALEETVENIQAAKGLAVQLSLPPHLDDCTTARQKLAVYRIVQEQLNNVIRHAKATQVNIIVTLLDDELQLAITDNGQGFNPAKAKKGLGLSNITNRAEALEGKAAFFSKPGRGARLQVVIPLVEREG